MDPSTTFEAEIDSAIDEVMAAEAAESEETGEESTGEVEDVKGAAPAVVESEDAEVDSSPTPKEEGLDESLLERAVKVGIPLAEAKKYTDGSLLESMVSRLEPASEGSQEGASDSPDPDVVPGGEGLLSKIPDLDPMEYDENIVNGFAAMKEIIRQQQEVIDGLKNGSKLDWFSRKMEPHAELVGGDASKHAAVREKFDVLKAGYKAAGRVVPDDAVFDEAAKLVLGEAMAEAKFESKTKRAKARMKQHISRTSGNRASAKGDPEQEIADFIDRKFFAK